MPLSKATATLASAAYTRDAAGNPTQVVEAGVPLAGTTVYGYDAHHRLVSAQYPDGSTAAWGYDSVGNRTSETKGGVTTTSTYDNANRLTAQGSTTFTYDSNGNRLSMSPGGRSTSYTYDPENRLKTVSGASSASFAYDGDGYRVSKTAGRTSTAYTWDRAGLGGLGAIIADGSGENLFGPAGLQERIAGGAGQYAHGPNCAPGARAA